MKIFCLILWAGLALTTLPCRAQQPANEPVPLILVYLAKLNDNALPRIALGLEKPALKISAFAKCVRISTANPKLMGLAAQLQPEDAKTLVAAIKAMGAPDARELPDVVIWFTTPDNKVLDYVNTGITAAESNLTKTGVLMFDPDSELTVVQYLNEKLHPN